MNVKGFICFMALLCSVAITARGGERVKGNGTLETKKITIGDFNEIKVTAAMDLVYEQSEGESYLEVTVDENLHPYVMAEVKDRKLTLGFTGADVDNFTKFVVKTNSHWLKKAEIKENAGFTVLTPLTGDETTIEANGNSLVQLQGLVSVGELELTVKSSANIVVDEVKVGKLSCNISGDGTITLKAGSASQGDFTLTNGELDAVAVAIPQLSCTIRGKGTAKVHATDKLKASVIGKGAIRYKGPTAVQESKMLGGTIEEIKE